MPRSHLRSLVADARREFDKLGYLPQTIVTQLTKAGFDASSFERLWVMA